MQSQYKVFQRFISSLARRFEFNKKEKSKFIYKYANQFSSVAQSYPTFCDPMDCSTPGLPVHHRLLEFTQTHVHWVSDAIQPSHPLLFPSTPTFNLSQDQSFFPMSQFFISGGKKIGVSASASVFPMNIQDWFPLGWIGLISFQFKGFSRVFSIPIVQKHQFFGAQLSLGGKPVLYLKRGLQRCNLGFPVNSVGKNLLPMQKMQVRSLGWEDLLEKEWQSTPVFLPEEFHEQRSLVGYSPWGCTELDIAKWLNNNSN